MVVVFPFVPVIASQVRAGLGSAIDLVADDPRKGHVVFSLALASPPLAQRRLQASEQMAQLMIELGLDRFTPGTTPRQLLFASRFLVGGFSEILAAWLRAPGGTTREEILDQCTDLFLAAASPLLNAPE